MRGGSETNVKKIAGVFLLALIVLAFFRPAEAQGAEKMPRVGFLEIYRLRGFMAFRQGLRDLGYVEGKNISIIHRSAEGKKDRLPELAAELVRKKVDVIVTGGQPVPEAARKATRTIPIVFGVVGDPVGDGLVASLNRPGGNITGLSSIYPNFAGKQLELFQEVLPGISRVAILWNPAHRSHASIVREAGKAARALGIRLSSLKVSSANALEGAFRRIIAERAEGILVMRGSFFIRNRKRIADLAVKARIPVMFGHGFEAESGGLMAYGPDVLALFRRAATYVDKILKGTKPADLPIERPREFELVINLKTAKAIGVTIPPEVLLRATKVIK